MAVYTIKVSPAVKDGERTLVLTPTHCEVDLDEEQPIRIVWVLDDGGTDAHFDLQRDKDGVVFDWQDKPGKEVFDAFHADPGMKILSTRDNHFRTGSFGQWRYRLRVRQGGALYKIPSDGGGGSHRVDSDDPGDSGKNPVIINR